jgi:membrane fusion protein (multidrug efflux system)
LLTACGKDEAAKPGGPGGRGGGPVPVVVETVAAQEWTDALRALGTVHAREAVTITAKVSETVQQVHFESGQQVARGAPLVTLSGQQQATWHPPRPRWEAGQLFLRQPSWAATDHVPRWTQRATRDGRAQVAQIRANLSDRVIRAPFAGVLGIRQVSPGALVTPGTAIATLDDVSRVFVDFPVPETELADVGAGQALVGHVATFGERSFDGRSHRVHAIGCRLARAPIRECRWPAEAGHAVE